MQNKITRGLCEKTERIIAPHIYFRSLTNLAFLYLNKGIHQEKTEEKLRLFDECNRCIQESREEFEKIDENDANHASCKQRVNEIISCSVDLTMWRGRVYKSEMNDNMGAIGLVDAFLKNLPDSHVCANRTKIASIYQFTGTIHLEIGNNLLALERFKLRRAAMEVIINDQNQEKEKVVLRRKSIHDATHMIITCQIQLARQSLAKGDCKDAHEYYKSAYEEAAAENDWREMARICEGLARVHAHPQMNNHAGASMYIEQAIAHIKSYIGNTLGEGGLLSRVQETDHRFLYYERLTGLASALFFQKEKGLQYTDKTIISHANNINDYFKSPVHGNLKLAEEHLQKKFIDEAMSFYRVAYDDAKKENDLPTMARICRALARVCGHVKMMDNKRSEEYIASAIAHITDHVKKEFGEPGLNLISWLQQTEDKHLYFEKLLSVVNDLFFRKIGDTTMLYGQIQEKADSLKPQLPDCLSERKFNFRTQESDRNSRRAMMKMDSPHKRRLDENSKQQHANKYRTSEPRFESSNEITSHRFKY